MGEFMGLVLLLEMGSVVIIAASIVELLRLWWMGKPSDDREARQQEIWSLVRSGFLGLLVLLATFSLIWLVEDLWAALFGLLLCVVLPTIVFIGDMLSQAFAWLRKNCSERRDFRQS